MKKILSILFVLFCLYSYGQKPNRYDSKFSNKKMHVKPSSTILKSFNKLYPNTKKVVWETIDSINYYAIFYHKNTNYIVKIDSNGEWLETIEDIDSDKFPDDVSNKLSEDYSKYDVYDSDKITTKNIIFYQIQLDYGLNEIFVQIIDNGILLIEFEVTR